MQPPDRPPHTNWGWFVLLFVVTVGSFELGWKIGRARIEDENNLLKDTKALKFAELITDLRSVSQRVAIDARERRELETFRATHAKEIERLGQLEKRSEDLSVENKKLAAIVASYQTGVFEVPTGDSKEFAPFWSVGVTDVNAATSEVTVQYGNNSTRLRPGAYFYVDVEEKRYVVTLMKAVPSTFRVTTFPVPKH